MSEIQVGFGRATQRRPRRQVLTDKMVALRYRAGRSRTSTPIRNYRSTGFASAQPGRVPTPQSAVTPSASRCGRRWAALPR